MRRLASMSSAWRPGVPSRAAPRRVASAPWSRCAAKTSPPAVERPAQVDRRRPGAERGARRPRRTAAPRSSARSTLREPDHQAVGRRHADRRRAAHRQAADGVGDDLRGRRSRSTPRGPGSRVCSRSRRPSLPRRSARRPTRRRIPSRSCRPCHSSCRSYAGHATPGSSVRVRSTRSGKLTRTDRENRLAQAPMRPSMSGRRDSGRA